MTSAHVRDERGSTLLTAVIMMSICMVMGLGLMQLGDTQDRAAASERIRESSLGMTEAALDAQVSRLSTTWPANAATAYPAQCTPSAAALTTCPAPAQLSSAFTSADNSNTRCAASAQTDWTTSVRDNGGSVGTYYQSTAAATQPAYDANGDGLVWVRAQGRAQCKLRTIVTQVRAGVVSMSFPYLTISANWFWTTNNGRKVIVDTTGEMAVGTGPAAHPAPVQVRCIAPLGSSPCLKVDQSKGQVGGSDPQTVSTMQTPVLPDAQADMLRARAKALGTYYSTPGCPSNVTGELVFVEDLGAAQCSIRGGNSSSSPGVLVFERGSLYIGGNDVFYGVIYARNKQATTGSVIELGGTSDIQGAIAVDGLGGVKAGASGANVVFDARALSMVQGFGTASPVPGTWRELAPGE